MHAWSGTIWPIDTLARVAHFEATRSSAPGARRFVTDALVAWGCDELLDDAALCTAELAANAVLHARVPFQVAVRFAGDGVRVEVVDGRPAQLPAPVPMQGVASELTALSTTGRGLQLVGALAYRWGYVTSRTAKSVWAELGPLPTPTPNPPVVALGYVAESASAALTLHLLSLPVRAAVASGIQVEELIRELQLGLVDHVTTAAERDHLYDLLDRSAAPRLAGRHAALQAAGAGDMRFDLHLPIDADGIKAVAELSELLLALPGRHEVTTATPTEEVLAFRAWLEEEVGAQLGGAEPRPCPLPDG